MKSMTWLDIPSFRDHQQNTDSSPTWIEDALSKEMIDLLISYEIVVEDIDYLNVNESVIDSLDK